MLEENGFSSNIRKVLNRLLEKGHVNKTNVKLKDKKRWETVYFNEGSLIEFIIKKFDNGWKIEKLKVNGKEISFEIYLSETDNSFNLKFDCDDFKDVAIFYKENEELNLLRSVRYSEIQDLLDGTDLNIEYIFDPTIFDPVIEEPNFEVLSEKGIRKKLTRSTSSIIGDELQQSFKDCNFDFKVNIKKRTISIKGSQYDSEEGSDEKILIDSVSLGEWDEGEESYDYSVQTIEKVVLYY